jgi:hypothetical protein
MEAAAWSDLPWEGFDGRKNRWSMFDDVIRNKYRMEAIAIVALAAASRHRRASSRIAGHRRASSRIVA